MCLNLNIRLIFDGRAIGNSFKRSCEKYTDKRIVMFRIEIFKNAAHFEIFFFRNIRVNHFPMSILISVAYVYCTSGADARQDFPSLTPIINHRSVISRDFSFPFGRTNFSQTKKKERDPTDTSILISKPRGIYARSRERILRKDTAGNLCTSSKWMQRYRRGRVTFWNFSPMDVAI